jgi:uncharacterized membrane protein YfcA
VTDGLLLFVAGLLGGVLNSIAGGGSFITFPALLFVGVPPVSANATNTFASCFGYLSGAYALRKDILRHRHELPRLVLVSLVGGGLGGWLLLQTPDSAFREAIPWLMLFAMVLFLFGGRLNAYLRQWAGRHRHATLAGSTALLMLFLAVCIYGGFFNAGLGIVILSYLALAGHTDINAMNGLKLLVSTAVSTVAIVVFLAGDLLAWYEGLIVLLGTLIGGYVSAHASRRLPGHWVRGFVILAGASITVYFFFDTYAS